MKQITQAMLVCQKNITNAHKDGTNPHFKNKYATLESVLNAVKETANANGIIIIQNGGKDSEGHFIETRLIHESGEEIGSRIHLALDKNNMQGLGSAITYARRYSLAALFAIGQEDDDGNKASHTHEHAPKITHPPLNEKPQVTTSSPPQDSIEDLNTYQYTINFGQWKGLTISQVADQFGLDKIKSYIQYIEDSAAKKSQKPSKDGAEFIIQATKFIVEFENTVFNFQG